MPATLSFSGNGSAFVSNGAIVKFTRTAALICLCRLERLRLGERQPMHRHHECRQERDCNLQPGSRERPLRQRKRPEGNVRPTDNFCTAGTATAVTGSGPWSWSCTGLNGGNTAFCSAPLNHPPTVAGTPNTAVTVPYAYSFVPTASDPTATSSPSASSISLPGPVSAPPPAF